MAARGEIGAQLEVIVNLAIADDVNASVLVGNRLPAAIEIDNAEPAHGQADAGFDEETVLIRSAVTKRVRHFAQESRAVGPIFRADVTGDAAHWLTFRAESPGREVRSDAGKGVEFSHPEKFQACRDRRIRNILMAKCDVCGNNYDKSFEIMAQGRKHVFDSFECAIHALAPQCARCGVRIIGHGLEDKMGFSAVQIARGLTAALH